jgi:uncharacterized membrane protein YeaQ/YmgE (transglycosylase-associated protein family)
MSLLELVVLLIIAGIAGTVAEFVVGFSPGGFLVSILIGVIGAYLGTWLAGQLNLPPILTININGRVFPLAWAIIGSLVLVMVLSLLRGRGPRRSYRRSYSRRRYYR